MYIQFSNIEDATSCENALIYQCNLMNELHEKNRELQRHLDVMRSGALTDDKRIKELYDENEQLKKVLGAILLEVKQDISNTNQIGEIRVFINPNSFNLISEVLRKYGALKEWYE